MIAAMKWLFHLRHFAISRNAVWVGGFLFFSGNTVNACHTCIESGDQKWTRSFKTVVLSRKESRAGRGRGHCRHRSYQLFVLGQMTRTCTQTIGPVFVSLCTGLKRSVSLRISFTVTLYKWTEGFHAGCQCSCRRCCTKLSSVRLLIFCFTFVQVIYFSLFYFVRQSTQCDICFRCIKINRRKLPWIKGF
jgi:hypothetical protein